jgi:hypothetical protein
MKRFFKWLVMFWLVMSLVLALLLGWGFGLAAFLILPFGMFFIIQRLKIWWIL